jgi:hypothetical protein
MQWRTLLPKGGGLIHMDVDGLPPFQLAHSSSFLVLQSFSSFRVPNFRDHFEALNNVFRAHNSYIVERVRF